MKKTKKKNYVYPPADYIACGLAVGQSFPRYEVTLWDTKELAALEVFPFDNILDAISCWIRLVSDTDVVKPDYSSISLSGVDANDCHQMLMDVAFSFRSKSLSYTWREWRLSLR